MPTIRELVAAIRQRDGVEAAIVLGRDGLLIDGQAVPNLDAEGLAAHVPSIVTAPVVGGSSAPRMYRSVLLPLPDGPIIAAASPGANDSDTSDNTAISPCGEE